MRYVMLIAASLFLLGTAAAYLGGAGLEVTDDITVFAEMTKDIAGVVLAVAALYLWFPRRGGSRPTPA